MGLEKIVIIGGTSGMGLETAKMALSEGKDVVIGGRSSEKLKLALSKLPGAVGYIVDASNSESLTEFYFKVGNFDHLVLALSGNKGFGMFRELAPEDVEAGFNEKVVAQIRATKLSLVKIASKGSITFISASSAQSSGGGISGYACINGALERMVPPLARELAPLRINAVSPGMIDTPWWDFAGDMKKAIFSQTEKVLPAGRIGRTSDIALVIMMIIKNSFITGTTILADGGGHLL